MIAVLLGCLASLVPAIVCAGDIPQVPTFHEDHSEEYHSEVGSEAFPPPKAPPPTEVTHVTGDEAPPDPSPQEVNVKPRLPLWAVADAALAANTNLVRRRKQQASESSARSGYAKFVSPALFTVALAVVFISLWFALFGRLPCQVYSFPPSLHELDVPSALSDLLSKRRIVVFLSDDCPSCRALLKDLGTAKTKPTAVFLTGQRLDRQVRKHLQIRYRISRLPVVFVNGKHFTDTYYAVQFIRLQAQVPSRKRLNASGGEEE